jgi:hypothetical protein
MSFDHWWIGFFIDEAGYELLKPHFTAAAQKATLAPAAQQALMDWRTNPSDFEQDAFLANPDAAAKINAFIWAFNLPGFDELAAQLLAQKGPLAKAAAEDRLFRIEMIARNTPVSIVWHALGYANASMLPGQMGNMLLHPRDIRNAEEKTRRAYADTSPSDLLDAARRYCSYDADDETLRNVIKFLPEALAQAAETGQGFLALGRAQL